LNSFVRLGMLEGIRSGDRRWQRSGGEESGGVAGIATSVQGEESGAAGTDAGKIWGRGHAVPHVVAC
jgi:hypothetical protein